jgi:hypothetical protein
MNWLKVVLFKVVYVPMPGFDKKTGEPKMRFLRRGIRVDFADGTWWFYMFSKKTYTRHWPKVPKTDSFGVVKDRYGRIVYAPERKDSFLYTEFEREFADRPEYKQAIAEAMESALIAEAEARAARV